MFDDGDLRALAADQHGLVAVRQTIELGWTKSQRHRLVDGHRWERFGSGVLRLVGAPATTGQRAMAGVLRAGPGAALRGASACAWFGHPGCTLEPLHVDVDRGHLRRPDHGVARHHPVLYPPHHVVLLEGIPTVVPARALFEVAGSRRGGAELPWWIDRVARLVDTAWSMRLVSGPTLHCMFNELARRGRAGTRVMRAVLVDRGLDYVPPASGVESRLMQLVRDAGLPELRRQVNVGEDGAWIGRVDFRAVAVPLVVEVQSERFHTSLIDRQLDQHRLDRLRRAGFVVVEVTDVEVWHQPGQAIRRLAEGFRHARVAQVA